MRVVLSLLLLLVGSLLSLTTLWLYRGCLHEETRVSSKLHLESFHMGLEKRQLWDKVKILTSLCMGIRRWGGMLAPLGKWRPFWGEE